jgi:hypothetical protein
MPSDDYSEQPKRPSDDEGVAKIHLGSHISFLCGFRGVVCFIKRFFNLQLLESKLLKVFQEENL